MRRTHLAPLLGSEAAALPLGAPARGAVAQRLRGRRSGVWSRGEKTERSQTNLSLRGAKRRGNPHPLYAMRKCTAAQKKKRIPTTSDVGHWSRNDSGFLYSAVSFLNLHLLSTGAECKRRTQQKSPRRGRPLCRPASTACAPKHYTTLPYFTESHYIILSAKHKPRKNQIRLFLFIFMCYNSLCIGIILYFYERHTQWDFSIRFSAATMTVS